MFVEPSYYAYHHHTLSLFCFARALTDHGLPQCFYELGRNKGICYIQFEFDIQRSGMIYSGYWNLYLLQ